MPDFKKSRQQLIDLMGQRSTLLTQAAASKDSGDNAGFKAVMEQVKNLNSQIDDVKALVDELDRYGKNQAPVAGYDITDMEELGREVLAGRPIKIAAKDAARWLGLRTDSTTLASTTLVQPGGAGTEIRSGFSGQVSSLIDQVYSINVTGLGSFEEPYVITEQEAQGGKVTTTAGTARTATDPTFGKAKISPYEISCTSFVDKNLKRLSPADYLNKIQTMAMNAVRRKANSLIVNGDGQASPDMFGILTAKNTGGTAIYNKLADITAIDADTLDGLVFGYGGDEFVGGNARLLLTKGNLKAIGALRGTNEKQRLYKITPDAGNPNTGIISDGGLIVPYTIVSAIGETMLAYGDPFNYELGLFGDIVIRVDESCKAVERMYAVLVDGVIGGNLIVDKGFVTQEIKAASSPSGG